MGASRTSSRRSSISMDLKEQLGLLGGKAALGGLAVAQGWQWDPVWGGHGQARLTPALGSQALQDGVRQAEDLV